MNRLAFVPLEPGDFGTLRTALGAAGLPTDDLGEPGRRFFALADDSDQIGFVGLEGGGADILLRSLVVFSARARQGYGSLLVTHAEAAARGGGAGRLHLLTTTAADFFRSRGYRHGDRAAAPPAIRATAQLASLCPGSATYLVKELA